MSFVCLICLILMLLLLLKLKNYIILFNLITSHPKSYFNHITCLFISNIINLVDMIV